MEPRKERDLLVERFQRMKRAYPVVTHTHYM